MSDTASLARERSDESNPFSLGTYEEWDAKLQELCAWTGSAFLAGEEVEDEARHKADLYRFLCGLIGWLMTARDAALSSQPGGWQAPEGFVLVPKEPSQDMKAVGGAMLEREVVLEWKNDDNSSWDDAATVYRAMIAAAPPVQTEKAE